MIATFLLHRDTDVSGISGVGDVAEVAVFTDGSCVMHWLNPPVSWSTYSSIADLLAIHGHGGTTTLVPTSVIPVQRSGR